ncbi:MAG: hypothetical protein IAG13_29735 [Deltaproteobacteria bacterium]|nr:hypothetical protein [Nannocystaceae bacterium]
MMRSWLLSLVALGTLAPGCSAVRRDSLKAIDRELQQQPRWERARAHGGFRLGPYTIVKRKLREHAVDQTPPMTIDAPRNPAWRYELELGLTREGSAPWIAHCDGRRRANIDADFAAISEIANDDVSIECELSRGEQRWHFSAAGRLDANFGGELVRADESGGRVAAKVEVILWMKRVKLISRHIAEPVAQVRRGEHAIAAMVLSRPEWAWVRAAEPEELRDAAMVTLVAIRMLPLGLDE